MDFQTDLFSQDHNEPVKSPSTHQLVKQLKDAGEDFEWYPTTTEQLNVVAEHISNIFEDYDVTSRYGQNIRLLDIGAGSGSALDHLSKHLESIDDVTGKVERLAIEKSTIHINSYRKRDIVLIGTEFNEVNFISKSCDFAFVNPPYKYYTAWLAVLLSQLNFKALYAVLPSRWKDCDTIKRAIKRRGITNVDVIGESDFYDAERQARAKVDIVCFYFGKMPSAERMKLRKDRNSHYKPTLGAGGNTPFQMFIENELGLVKTTSKTTNEFREHEQKERIRREMAKEGSDSHQLVKYNGVLAALIDNYERDMQNVLEQYKKISSLSGTLLDELGVDYDALVKGVKDKLYGFRRVYWQLLFEHLDAISSRLISSHKIKMLNTLNANALDFTERNAIYIIGYAVDIANESIDEGMISVFKKLTSPETVLKYYKSNERVYNDNWRYNSDDTQHKDSKRLLDYRFVYSSHSNFHIDSWKHGLNDSAREFVSDIKVIFTLLGYSKLTLSHNMDDMAPGKKLAITGTLPTGKSVTLITITFYKNGNRHLRWCQQAMLRFNCTVAQILGWVRSKEEFERETDIEAPVKTEDWEIANTLHLTPNNIALLAGPQQH